MESSDTEIVQHRATLQISDLIDDFCIHDDLSSNDQVGDKLTHSNVLIQHVKAPLLLKRQSAEAGIQRPAHCHRASRVDRAPTR